MPPNPSTGVGEAALWDVNQTPSLIVANAPGSGATGTLRLWGSQLYGLATYPAATEGFNIPSYDYISMAYSGSNVTGVGYYQGGATGTLVATLTLGYSGSNVTSATLT